MGIIHFSCTAQPEFLTLTLAGIGGTRKFSVPNAQLDLPKAEAFGLEKEKLSGLKKKPSAPVRALKKKPTTTS
jgi:hypothetical protein